MLKWCLTRSKANQQEKAGTSLAVAGHVYDEMLVLTRSFESCRIRLSIPDPRGYPEGHRAY